MVGIIYRKREKWWRSDSVWKRVKSRGIVVIAPFGFFGFIPGSQIGSKYDVDPEKLLGKRLKRKFWK